MPSLSTTPYLLSKLQKLSPLSLQQLKNLWSNIFYLKIFLFSISFSQFSASEYIYLEFSQETRVLKHI